MAFKFNVFTSNFDIVDSGTNNPFWLPPVNTRIDLPSGDSDGACRVVLDEESVFTYDSGSDVWHNTRLNETQFVAAINAAGITIEEVTTSGVSDYRINLHPASATTPGGVSTGTQTFAGTKTFNDDVIVEGDLTINGTTTTVNTAVLDVEDQNITINNNGNDATAEGAGLTVERTGVDGSFVYEDALASKWKIGQVGSESEVVDVDSTQNLTNKNLKSDTNLLTGASVDSVVRETGNQNSYSIPDSSTNDIFVLEDHPQTLLNKTLDNTNDATLIDNNFTLQDNLDNTRQAQFNASNITSGNTRTYDLPDANTEIVGTDTTQTLTNKTIDGDDNTLQDISLPSLKTELADANKFIQRDATGAVISGKDVPVGDVVGTSDAQVLTSKSIDADNNTITNIDDDEIKANAGINATKIADGSVDNTEFQALDGVTSNIQDQLDARVVGPVASTDEALARYDGVTGKIVQDSLVTLNDAGVLGGATRLDVDNISIDGNDVFATNTDGNVNLIPNGTGHVDINSSLVKNVLDPVDDQDAATKKYVDDNTSFEPGDLDQVDFSINNNQSSLANVTGVSFANGVTRSAELQYSIFIDATTSLYESGKIFAVQRGADWSITHEANGDNSQVLFDINASGQLQYTSANYAGFVSGTLKVRAVTTSI